MSALRSRMNRKKEASEAETKIGGFEDQFLQLADMFEEELKDSKHYAKIVAKINKALNKDKTNQLGSLRDSAKAFVGLLKKD